MKRISEAQFKGGGRGLQTMLHFPVPNFKNVSSDLFRRNLKFFLKMLSVKLAPTEAGSLPYK